MEMNIRLATAEDCAALASVKTAYVRTLFRGILTQQELKLVAPENYRDTIAAAIEAPGRQVLVLQEPDRIAAYVIFGADPEEPGYGMIFDCAFAMDCDHEHRDRMITMAVNMMADAGMDQVHFWLMRENFFARFQLESFGFKEEGILRNLGEGDHEMQMMRYLYRTHQS